MLEEPRGFEMEEVGVVEIVILEKVGVTIRM